MPREMVLNCDGGPYAVKVGWSQDRSLQIGVEGDQGRSLFWLAFGPEKLTVIGEGVATIAGSFAEHPISAEECGRRLLDLLDTASHGGYQGVWATLDRQGANRLIRVLRKARDAAFGADA